MIDLEKGKSEKRKVERLKGEEVKKTEFKIQKQGVKGTKAAERRQNTE